jgi:hypothetical protein
VTEQLTKPNKSTNDDDPIQLLRRSNELSKMEEMVGGRDSFAAILDLAPESARKEILVRMLQDPLRAKDSLFEICREARIPGKEILQLFREASFQKAYFDAHITFARSLKGVAEDISEKAINHVEDCPCTLGGIEPPVPDCSKCGGKGRVYYRSSLDHQQLLLETAGVLQRKGGVNVQVQQNVGIGIGTGLFDKFVKATDQAAYTLDAEVIPNEKEDHPLPDPQVAGTEAEV